MAQKSKTQKWIDIHEEALAEFDNIYSAQGEERELCKSDRRFYSIAGAQWEGKHGEQFKDRPKFEINKILLSIIRIFNEYRNNRISVDFVPKDGAPNDKLADMCDMLLRAHEQDSSAEEAYDNAFEESVGGGIGAWRYRAVYEDEDDDDNEFQTIRIEPILEADSCVFFNNEAKRQDKSDAICCFVITSMSPSQYENEWDESPDSWDVPNVQSEFDWCTDDTVYVAEYYKVEQRRDYIQTWANLDGKETKYSRQDFIDDDDLEEFLLSTGHTLVREKKIKRRTIVKYILSGGGVLDEEIIPGTRIPINPIYGKRWVVDNVERMMGHVRPARDCQIIKNMQISKLGEYASLSSLEKPIFDQEQITNHTQMWAEDNTKNWPYLTIDALRDENDNVVVPGPIGYTKSPNIPPALAALLQITEQDMKDILGNQQAGDELMSNVSGVAYDAVQSRLDMQSFIYVSNFAKGIKSGAEIWLSMARHLLVEKGRSVKLVGKKADVESGILNNPILGDDTGTEYENDMTKANFDVTVTIGPHSTTKRQSTVKTLTNMMGVAVDPETQQVLSSLIMMNTEGEGVTEVRDYFRDRLVKMGVIKPSEQEQKEMEAAMANIQPDANTKFLEASAQEAMANAENKQADSALKAAKTELTQAEILETLANIEREDQQAAVDTVAMLDEMQRHKPID